MKTFSIASAGLAALLLAGCAPATTIHEKEEVVINPISLPLDLGSATSVPTNITLKAGENNLKAKYSPLSLTTDESANTNQVVYDYGANTVTWADDEETPMPRDPEEQALQFSIKAVGPATEDGKNNGQNAYTILTIKKLTFTDMADKTGITFSIKVTGGLVNAGVKAFIRSVGTANDVNANAWTAPLNSAPNTDYDWVWFGHGQFVNFKVPFSKFVKAGGATQTQDTIADALADDVVFDQLEIAFRMDTADNGTLNTAYTGFLDNVALY